MLPATAMAHASPALSTDYEARVEGFRPPAPGLVARVLGSDQRLELRVEPGRVVVVLGVEHEPFLRFSSAGVEANLASPTAVSARVIASADAVVAATARWRRIAGGHVFAWHESRLRPLPHVSDSSSQPRRVAGWSIPLIVDAHAARLEGGEWHAIRPPLWPWLAAGALALALSGVAARRLSRQALRRIAIPLTAVAVGALIAGWAGILFVDGATPIGVLLALAAAVATALGLAALLSAATGTARLGAAALIGVLSMTFALPELSVFMHGYVLSALSGTLARLAAEAGLVSGASIAILCVPSVLEFFDELDPVRQSARA
ncbi:MAG: hypothetical protein QOJ12_805 [Thermoleophilales bacterium]|nr:hypothetical protein [Thermoleophilales bacterium]